MARTDEDIRELLNWAWDVVPGLVLAYQITGKDSMLQAMQRIREEKP